MTLRTGQGILRCLLKSAVKELLVTGHGGRDRLIGRDDGHSLAEFSVAADEPFDRVAVSRDQRLTGRSVGRLSALECGPDVAVQLVVLERRVPCHAPFKNHAPRLVELVLSQRTLDIPLAADIFDEPSEIRPVSGSATAVELVQQVKGNSEP